MEDIKFWEESRDHWADSTVKWIELGQSDRACECAKSAAFSARMMVHCYNRIFDKF